MKVNQAELIQAAMTFIPILKKNQIKILVGDCDSKLHNEKLADLFWEQGIFCGQGLARGVGSIFVAIHLGLMTVILASLGSLSGKMMLQSS